MPSCFLEFFLSFTEFIHVLVLFRSVKLLPIRFLFKYDGLLFPIRLWKFYISEVFVLHEPKVKLFGTQLLSAFSLMSI